MAASALGFGPFFGRRENVQQQAAGDRLGFLDAYLDLHAQTEAPARVETDQGMLALDMLEAFLAQRGDRHQAVCPGLGQAHESAKARDAGDPALELAADMVGQIKRDEPVHGIAFGGHGAAFGVGDFLGDGFQPGALVIGLAIGTQIERADQRTVDSAGSAR